MITPDHPEGEISFVAIQETVEPLGETTIKWPLKIYTMQCILP